MCQPLEGVEFAESPTGERDNVVEEVKARSYGSTEGKSSTPLPLQMVLRQLLILNPDPQPTNNAPLGMTRHQTRQLQESVHQLTAHLLKKPTTDCLEG